MNEDAIAPLIRLPEMATSRAPLCSVCNAAPPWEAVCLSRSPPDEHIFLPHPARRELPWIFVESLMNLSVLFDARIKEAVSLAFLLIPPVVHTAVTLT